VQQSPASSTMCYRVRWDAQELAGSAQFLIAPEEKLHGQHETARVHHAPRRRGRSMAGRARAKRPAMPEIGYLSSR
jgi:hypothetical protein